MATSPKNSLNADLYCSLFGHNYTLKSDPSDPNEVYECKTCSEKFTNNTIEEISGSPKTSEYISIFRTLLTRFKSKNKRIIS